MQIHRSKQCLLGSLCTLVLLCSTGCSDSDDGPQNNFNELKANLWEFGDGEEFLVFTDSGVTGYNFVASANCYNSLNSPFELVPLGGVNYANTESPHVTTVSDSLGLISFNEFILAETLEANDSDFPLQLDLWEQYVITGTTLTQTRAGFAYNSDTFGVKEYTGDNEEIIAILAPFDDTSLTYTASNVVLTDLTICP